jgi:hypothetical protein
MTTRTDDRCVSGGHLDQGVHLGVHPEEVGCSYMVDRWTPVDTSHTHMRYRTMMRAHHTRNAHTAYRGGLGVHRCPPANHGGSMRGIGWTLGVNRVSTGVHRDRMGRDMARPSGVVGIDEGGPPLCPASGPDLPQASK